jgi:hypothetical protein
LFESTLLIVALMDTNFYGVKTSMGSKNDTTDTTYKVRAMKPQKVPGKRILRPLNLLHSKMLFAAAGSDGSGSWARRTLASSGVTSSPELPDEL